MSEIIRVENLRKEFGETIALKEVSFSIEQGEIFGYLGPNGAGKTTTMRILLGILRASSGQAILFGEDVSKDSAEVRGRVGFVLEDQRLYERLSAYDNLEYYARIYQVPKGRREEKIKRLLEFVGLWENKNELVGRLSKGMKQKLGIARSLVHDPEVLFYDEPTAGLDPEMQVIISFIIVFRLFLSLRISISTPILLQIFIVSPLLIAALVELLAFLLLMFKNILVAKFISIFILTFLGANSGVFLRNAIGKPLVISWKLIALFLLISLGLMAVVAYCTRFLKKEKLIT
jgi:ABC-type Na+ transport system ATPase subunit NatA